MQSIKLSLLKLCLLISLAALYGCGRDNPNLTNSDLDSQMDNDTDSQVDDDPIIDDGPQCRIDPITRTTGVQTVLNLDAGDTSPVLVLRRLSAEGNDVGVVRSGRISASATEQRGGVFTLPLFNDFNTTDIMFDIQLSAASGRSGAVYITLGTSEGVPAQVNSFNDIRILVSVINAQISAPPAPQTAIDVLANAVDLGGGNYRIEFVAQAVGEPSQIGVSFQSGNANEIGLGASVMGISLPGIPAVSNAYPAQSIDIQAPDGNAISHRAVAGESAGSIATQLSLRDGVRASASTRATLSNFVSPTGDMVVTLNGLALTSTSLFDLDVELNALSETSLAGFTATMDADGANLLLTLATGEDIVVGISSTIDGDSLMVTGRADAGSQVLEVDALGDGVALGNVNATTEQIVVGGTVDIFLSPGYQLWNPQPVIGLFQPLGDTSDPLNPQLMRVYENSFDPDKLETFNFVSTQEIYDSLGIEHTLSLFFVKQPFNSFDLDLELNHWEVHVQIDERDVGDPDTGLSPPDNTQATRLTRKLLFDSGGTLSQGADAMLISNWQPLTNDGVPNGAAGPENVLVGGGLPVILSSTSSNFELTLVGSTQTGSVYRVLEAVQNGAGELGVDCM